MAKRRPQIVNQEYELVDVSKLTEHPDNARRGNMHVIEESIEQNDFYGAVYVQRSTGHVLVGNHRFRGAKKKGFKQLPVIWLDVDDEKAKRILLVDNRSSDKGGYDDKTIARLLSGFTDYKGTGFSDEEVMKLMQVEPVIVDKPAPAKPEPPKSVGEQLVSENGHVKMVPLFFSTQQREEFDASMKVLSKAYGTENVTDTVAECVRRARAAAQ